MVFKIICSNLIKSKAIRLYCSTNNSVEKLQIGSKAKLCRTFTDSDVNAFALLTGDTNPLHTDYDYASKTHFRKCIVHGAMINGLVSALLGTVLPGVGSILANQVLNFTKPLYINEKVCAEVIITNIIKRENKKQIIECQYVCTTEEGKTVLDGTARLVLLN